MMMDGEQKTTISTGMKRTKVDPLLCYYKSEHILSSSWNYELLLYHKDSIIYYKNYIILHVPMPACSCCACLWQQKLQNCVKLESLAYILERCAYILERCERDLIPFLDSFAKTNKLNNINTSKKETPHSFKGQQLKNKLLYRFVIYVGL